MISLLLTLLGCASTLDVDLALCPEMPSVVEVTWTRSGDGPVWVEYGEDGRWRADGGPGGAGEAARVLVAGATPGELLQLEAFEGRGVNRHRSGPLEITTEILLASPAGLRVASEGQDDGRWLLTTVVGEIGPYLAGIAVYDRAGRAVWFHGLPEDQLAVSAQPALDGDGFWYLSQGMDVGLTDAPGGSLVHVGLDGVVVEELSLPMAHHAFVELPSGGVLVNERTVEENPDGSEFFGQRIVEIKGGDTKELVDLRDALYLEVVPSEADPPHANGLVYDPGSGLLLWSVVGYQAVIAFDPGRLEVPWSISALDTDMMWPMGVDMPMLHAPAMTQDGELLVFDNGWESGTAQVRAFAMDLDARALASSWTYPRAEGEDVVAMGDIKELPDGQLLISWGARGELEELDADRQRVWFGAASLGEAMGNVHRLDSLAPGAQAER